jgi:hypothetical protein
MIDWREQILEKFPKTPQSSIIVSDVDGIIQDLTINKKLLDQGYTILYYHSSNSFNKEKYKFRYTYEKEYRDNLDKKILITIQAPKNELKNVIPYDIWIKGSKVYVSLHELFPKLNYPVISKLESSIIDRLYKAYQLYHGTKMGEKATSKYVLSTGYQLNPDTLLTLNDLFSNLLRIHYNSVNIPENLEQYLIEQLKLNPEYENLPIKNLLHRDTFYNYIQEQWESYIEDRTKGKMQSLISFENPQIIPYIDTLFTEGRLKPLEVENPNQVPRWMSIGIKGTETQSTINLLGKVLKGIETSLQKPDKLYIDWLKLAENWAQAIIFKTNMGKDLEGEISNYYKKIQLSIESQFGKWIINNISALNSLRLEEPITVSQICDYLNLQIKNGSEKKLALLIIDGISIDQWKILERTIKERTSTSYSFIIKPIYAEIPTITSVSRQSIFSGNAPFYFKDTLLSTDHDERHWCNYWKNENITAGYIRGLYLNKESEVDLWKNLLTNKVVGMVINYVDDAMHNAKLGTASMYDSIKRWVTDGYLLDLLTDLFDNGYDVYISSDHGNIESRGIGRENQGVLVESAGSRVRIYSNPEFAEQAHKKYPKSIIWNERESSLNYTFLFPPVKKSFSRKNTRKVSHGGLSIEETIVPFIKVRRDHET